jgi:hypothetical protein
MHYIVGTRFTVTPGIKFARGVRDKQFVPGVTYALLNINKVEEQYNYKFKGSNGVVIDILFLSCNEGDQFIAKYRNEKLPQPKVESDEFFRLD